LMTPNGRVANTR